MEWWSNGAGSKQGEFRMSNKEFRMMKCNCFDSLLRNSSFDIRPARNALERICDSSLRPMGAAAIIAPPSTLHGRRVFCGSLLSFCEQ
jgi:hypothetical protein